MLDQGTKNPWLDTPCSDFFSIKLDYVHVRMLHSPSSKFQLKFTCGMKIFLKITDVQIIAASCPRSRGKICFIKIIFSHIEIMEKFYKLVRGVTIPVL